MLASTIQLDCEREDAMVTYSGLHPIPQLHSPDFSSPTAPKSLVFPCFSQPNLFQPRAWLKLPSILDDQLQLHPVTSAVPTQLSSAFHRRLATDARQRGEADRGQAHEVLAELETGAVTARQLRRGWWNGWGWRVDGTAGITDFFMLKPMFKPLKMEENG